MLGIQLFNMMRAMAWTLITSMPVGPERTLLIRPFKNMGASELTKLRGTNSVKPPVCCWMSRSNAMCLAICSLVSTCPNITVEVVGIPN